jgi:hypothetical protein
MGALVNRRLVVQPSSALKRTFPHLSDAPASVRELLERSLVAPLVLRNLLSPKFRARRRPFEEMAVVTVPEAPLGEENGPKSWEREVWLTREIRPV